MAAFTAISLMECRRRMLRRLRPYYRRRQLGMRRLENDVDRLMELVTGSERLCVFTMGDAPRYRCEAYARMARLLWGHRRQVEEWMLTLVRQCGEFMVSDDGFGPDEL